MPSKEEYWKNPEKYRKDANAYRIKNPEWKKRTSREWAAKIRLERPEVDREKQKRYRQAHPEICKERTKEWLTRHPGYYMLKNAFQRSKDRGLPFNITLADIIIPAVCPVLGMPFGVYRGQGRGGFKPDAPSLDRIIPSLGYVRGNICVISNLANSIKRDGTAEQLMKVAVWLSTETARVEAELAHATS